MNLIIIFLMMFSLYSYGQGFGSYHTEQFNIRVSQDIELQHTHDYKGGLRLFVGDYPNDYCTFIKSSYDGSFFPSTVLATDHLERRVPIRMSVYAIDNGWPMVTYQFEIDDIEITCIKQLQAAQESSNLVEELQSLLSGYLEFEQVKR